jgi:DegV family protein with EDD domain
MVRIIADTTCVLPQALCKELNIPILPQIINIGEKSYRDDTELDTATFIKMLKESPIYPQTAAPPPLLYHPIFEEILATGDSIVVVCPSNEISGTFRSATVAAQDFPEANIHIVDTRTVAGGLANLVLMAHEWAQAGMDAPEIAEKLVEKRRHERLFFMVDTLEYLAKGGRIGNAKALLGGILQLRPILTLKNGVITPFENQRTRHKALARMIELSTKTYRAAPDSRLNIVQASAEDLSVEIAEKLKLELGISEIPIYNQCASIVTHAGPGAICISFFDESFINE